jgi:hypothetical protein
VDLGLDGFDRSNSALIDDGFGHQLGVRNSIATGLLRSVKGFVGRCDEIAWSVGCRLYRGNPKAGGNSLVRPHVRLDRVAKALDRLEAAAQVGVRHHNHELLAPISRNDVGAASSFGHHRCQAPQHFIAGGVPERIVVCLESVDIQER